jgi:flotillin
MTIEEIFKERKLFKEHVMKNVQSELAQFGMIIYNANVKELQDAPGSEYFKYLRLKSHEGAINQAKVDVAQAKFKGAVGEKEREGEQRKATSKIESDAGKRK